MSGSRLVAMTRDEAAQAADRLLKKLGVARTDIRKLQSLPFSTLLAAQAEVEASERSRGEAPRSFSPVIGNSIPRDPFAPDAPAESAHVPLIVSTVLDERSYRESNFEMGWDAVRKVLQRLVGDRSDEVLAMYRNEDSQASPFIINARIITDTTFRRSAQTMADRKAAQGGAPVWMYLWTTPSSAFGGRYGATHATDVAPSMHDVRFPLSGPNANNLRLADQLAGAWASLAATGDPNNARTPRWPTYDTTRRTTLVFGDPTHAVDDPRREFRELWDKQAMKANG
jgi:para-nitrobenzyl esterase